MSRKNELAGNVVLAPCGAQVALPLVEVTTKRLKKGKYVEEKSYHTRPIRNEGTPATRSDGKPIARYVDETRGGGRVGKRPRAIEHRRIRSR